MRILLIAVLAQQVQLILMAYSYSDAKNLRNIITSDYDQHSRPANVTTVQVGLHLVSVKNLDWKEQALSAAGWFTVVWTNSVISWYPLSFNGLTLAHFVEGETWRPDIVIENSVDYVGPVVEEHLHYRVLNSGVVVWEPQVQFKVRCEMDMTYYPFDRHKCSMVISSWAYTATEVAFSPLTSVVSLDKYAENAEWELSNDPQIQATSETRVVNTESRTYSKLTFEFELKRRTDMYGIMIFLPLIILTVLSMLVFVLPAETGEKSVYCVAILLAVVLMVTVYYDELPVGRYLPIIVVYVVVVFILVALCVVCSVFTLYLHHHDTNEPLSPLMVSAGLFLTKLTCSGRLDNSEDTDDSWKVHTETNIEENTRNNTTNLPQTPPQSAELPNGNAVTGQTLSGRKLKPIERNRVRPRSDSSRKANVSMNSQRFQDECLDDPITWKGIAKNLNKVCLVSFIVLSFLVHFVFIVALAVGGSMT